MDAVDVVVGVKLSKLNPTSRYIEKYVANSNFIAGATMNSAGEVLTKIEFTQLGCVEIEGDIFELQSIFNGWNHDDDFVNPFGNEHPKMFTLGIDDSRRKTIHNSVIGFSIYNICFEGDIYKIDPIETSRVKSKMEDWLKNVLQIENIEICSYVISV